MFSYEDYKEIIRIIQSTGNQAGYEEALTADKFVIMRHDVEYSVDRAYALAKVESSMDFTSTFFFQWTNSNLHQFMEKYGIEELQKYCKRRLSYLSKRNRAKEALAC